MNSTNIISQLDLHWTELLSQAFPHNAFFNMFFSIVSMREIGLAFFVLAILFVIIYEEEKHHFKKRLLHTILLTGFAALATSIINDVFLKALFSRARPFMTISNWNPFLCPETWSFPSGHTAVAFAVAMVLSKLDHNSKRHFLYFGIAVLIGYSRIYLGCHYLFDVLGGAIVGALIGYLIIKFPPFFETKKSAK